MHGLKAIIVGAGMGGLTTAIAMRNAGFDCAVYDRVGALQAAGAGVSLWSNGVKVLNRLGLGAAVAAIGGRMERVIYRRHDGETLTDFALQPLVDRVGQRPYPVTRTELQHLLLSALPDGLVHLNSECVDVEQDAHSATAIFRDGRRVCGDLVVAADGTHSKLRGHVLGTHQERRYVGYVNWNGLVPASKNLAPERSWVVYVGQHQRASMMPVGGERLYFFFDVPLPALPAGAKSDPSRFRAELSAHFKGWAEPVQQLIAQLDPQTTNRVEIHDLDPLPCLVRGRVALLGDAGHSTAPDLGQGGCQAMEDAWTLAHCLLTTNIGVEDALQRYDAARRDRVADVIRKARKRAHMTHGHDPARTLAWYDELAQEDGHSIMRAIGDTIVDGPMG